MRSLTEMHVETAISIFDSSETISNLSISLKKKQEKFKIDNYNNNWWAHRFLSLFAVCSIYPSTFNTGIANNKGTLYARKSYFLSF